MKRKHPDEDDGYSQPQTEELQLDAETINKLLDGAAEVHNFVSQRCYSCFSLIGGCVGHCWFEASSAFIRESIDEEYSDEDQIRQPAEQVCYFSLLLCSSIGLWTVK
jgi:hypothetical protein